MTEEEFLTAQSMGLLSMDWEYHSSTLLRQTREYYDKWPMVEVVYSLYPNSAGLGVEIREALTEQEKRQREEENRQRQEEIRRWEEETLRKSRFTAWDRENDEFFQTWKSLEDSYLEEVEWLEQEEYILFPNMSWMPYGVPFSMTLNEEIFKSNCIDSESDTDEVMAVLQNLVDSDSSGVMKVMLQELLDIDQLNRNMEVWRTLLREQKDKQRKEIQEKIEDARNRQLERVRDMEADDRRSQRHILEREAHHRDFARTFDRTIARSVGHEFSLKSLKEATGLVERMIKHRAIIPDDKMKERYGILFFDAPFRDMLRVGGAFKDFNEFSENTLISGRPSQMSLI